MNFYLKTRDHACTGEEFTLEMDEELQLLRTTPCPEQLEKYYHHEAYISHTDESSTFIDKIYQLVKKYGLRKKESWIRKYAGDQASLLDIGAGTGSFVAHMRTSGWETEGIEPNKRARNVAMSKGVHLHAGRQDLEPKKYDVITLWHVLEHFRDLHGELDWIVNLLKDNGTLFVAVPNFRSYDAKHYEKFWAAYDVPRHLWHFSRPSIETLFKDRGWEVIRVKPMLFDAFYIALLSERYKGTKLKSLPALWTGLRSNVYGWKTGEYSSLAYILKKA